MQSYELDVRKYIKYQTNNDPTSNYSNYYNQYIDVQRKLDRKFNSVLNRGKEKFNLSRDDFFKWLEYDRYQEIVSWLTKKVFSIADLRIFLVFTWGREPTDYDIECLQRDIRKTTIPKALVKNLNDDDRDLMYMCNKLKIMDEQFFQDKLAQYREIVESKASREDRRAESKIQALLNDPQLLNENQFTRAILYNDDRQITYQKYKNDLLGHKTIEEWYDLYSLRFKSLETEQRLKEQELKKRKRVSTRPDATNEPVPYPFKSKISKYRKTNPGEQIEYVEQPIVERIDEKQFYRPYFSPEPGAWEIDFAFHMCKDKDVKKDENDVEDTWLFCVNINTRYLEIYQCAKKSTNDVYDSLKDLIETYDVKSFRGDGEAAFKSRKVQDLLDRKNVKYNWNDGKFTNHNKIVDAVIKTIRNAIGYREIDGGQLQKIVNYYNNTYHRSIDCTPAEMQNNPDLEYQYIRWCEQKLNYIINQQKLHGLLNYQPGNILLVHLDKGKTSNKFEKRRTFWDRCGEFVEYINGNVRVRLLTPVKIATNSDPRTDVVVPIYHTRFLAKNKYSIPEGFVKNYTVNLPGTT